MSCSLLLRILFFTLQAPCPTFDKFVLSLVDFDFYKGELQKSINLFWNFLLCLIFPEMNLHWRHWRLGSGQWLQTLWQVLILVYDLKWTSSFEIIPADLHMLNSALNSLTLGFHVTKNLPSHYLKKKILPAFSLVCVTYL